MAEFLLNAEQADLAASIREMVEQYIMPHALDMDIRGDDSFDWSFVKLLSEHNLLAPNIPVELGGRGLDFLSTAVLIEEIARGCAGLAACIVGEMHATIPIILGGNKKQKEKFLPALITEPVLAAFGLTEPKGGSDVKKLSTTIEYKKGKVVINGIKDYIVNGAVASLVTVCASTNIDHSRSSYRFVIVPRDQLQVSMIRNKMGIKYCNTAQLVFDSSVVPETNVIGAQGGGYLLLNQTLESGRTLIAAIQVGVAKAAYELVLEFAQKHRQFEHAIFSNQGISFPLVEMATIIDAARFMVWRACWLIDQGEDFTKASSMARLYASSVSQKVTSMAIDIMGAMGYTTDSLLNVYYRDAKVGSIVGGTDNVQRMIIASLL